MLHHYTTVNTLALMLRHQTLRFTRLDQFDDVTEGRALGPYPAGARMFASCWSAADEESIPQWAMYGDAMRGVRISLREDPFIWHPVDIRWNENFQFINLLAPYSIEEMLSSGVTLTPTVDMRSTFGRQVQYVSDVPEAIQTMFDVHGPSAITLHGDGSEIAFLKSDRWAFQQEYRYVLLAGPGPAEAFHGDVETYISARRAWMNSGINLVTAIPDRRHIDLHLAGDALANATIAIGPLAPGGTAEIVEALVARFAPGAKVMASALLGTVRPR